MYVVCVTIFFYGVTHSVATERKIKTQQRKRVSSYGTWNGKFGKAYPVILLTR